MSAVFIASAFRFVLTVVNVFFLETKSLQFVMLLLSETGFLFFCALVEFSHFARYLTFNMHAFSRIKKSW